jgi:hypothetical protein
MKIYLNMYWNRNLIECTFINTNIIECTSQQNKFDTLQFIFNMQFISEIDPYIHH